MHALKGETVTHILITHTHSDHSPAAAPLKAATGAKTYGFGPHGAGKKSEGVDVEEGGDMAFRPDVTVTRRRRDQGRRLDLRLRLHAGPHLEPHVLCAARGEGAVLGRPRHGLVDDGDRAARRRHGAVSRKPRKAARRATTKSTTRPTAIPSRNRSASSSKLIEHRHARERQIAVCLKDGVDSHPRHGQVIYSEIDKKLHPAAAMSVLAHLRHMVATGRAATDGAATATSTYRLA